MTFSGYDHQGSRHAICQVVLPWAVDALDVLRCAQRKWLWLRLACAGATRAAAAVFFEWKHHGDGNQERNLECQRWHTDWSSALPLWSKFLFYGFWSVIHSFISWIPFFNHLRTPRGQLRVLEPGCLDGGVDKKVGWAATIPWFSMIYYDILMMFHDFPTPSCIWFTGPN